jgi:hypothetical protein
MILYSCQTEEGVLPSDTWSVIKFYKLLKKGLVFILVVIPGLQIR